MRATLVVNPEAGRGLGRELGPAVAGYLNELHVTTHIQNSAGQGDVETKVRAALAEKPDVVIAAGGDGTVHEAVNGCSRPEAARRWRWYPWVPATISPRCWISAPTGAKPAG